MLLLPEKMNSTQNSIENLIMNDKLRWYKEKQKTHVDPWKKKK